MKRLVFLVAVGFLLFHSTSSVPATIEPRTSGEYHHLSRYYADTGQYQAAIANYRAMIGKYPNTGQAEDGWLGMGNCYYRLMLQAKAELMKAKERVDATAREIARLEETVHSYMNDAVSSYRKVVKQFPDSKAAALIRIGLTYDARGPDWAAEARLRFQKAVDSYPEEAARAQLLLGDSYLKSGDRKKARQLYSTARAGFPEVASLAELKLADSYFDADDFSRASDACQEVIDYLGIDGAYDSSYHLSGGVMDKAIAKRGEAERALKNIENELGGYTSVISRFPGTRVCMQTRLRLAEAHWLNDRKVEAEKLLRGIASEYPKSLWAVKALLRLAELQGSSAEAVATYGEIISAFPESRFWVKVNMKLAEAYLGLADEEDDPVEKKYLKGKARDACNAVIAAYPFCPGTDSARDFMKKKGL